MLPQDTPPPSGGSTGQLPRRLSAALRLAVANGQGPDLDSPVADPELCRAVARLSALFTRERRNLQGGYWEEAPLRRAYLAYFLPVNLAKVQALLAELPEESSGPPAAPCPLMVLDVGAGQGTATLGCLDWISRGGAAGRSVRAVAVDRAETALADCRRLWEGYVGRAPSEEHRLATLRLDLEQASALERLGTEQPGPYDVIVLANCLNELFTRAGDPVARRAGLIRLLLPLLASDGTLMVIEPALREASRGLHRVRDLLLAERRCTVYSPCLHERPCPALIKETDWCHEERPWEPPPLVAAIDRQVGLIKDALKFSYLLLRKDGRRIVPCRSDVYRVVSELRVMKGEKRVWLCNEAGRPEVGRLDRARSASNAPFDDCRRGTIVRISEIVRRERKGRETTVGRVPGSAAVEVIRHP